MAIQTLTCIPESFEAGSTCIFTESFTDFPTSTWAAYLILALPGAAPIRVDATVSNSKFLFTLVSATTAGYTPGWYDYAIYCTSGSERGKAKSGRIAILDNLAVAQPPTHAQQMVTALEGALLLLGATSDASVSFNGQSFTQASIGTYRADLTYWQARVIRERDDLARLRGTQTTGFVAINFG